MSETSKFFLCIRGLTFCPSGNRVQEGKHGNSSEATQDDRYTQVELWILMAGTAGSADLVSALDREEVQDHCVSFGLCVKNWIP